MSKEINLSIDPIRLRSVGRAQQLADTTREQARSAIKRANEAQEEYDTALADLFEKAGVSATEYAISPEDRKFVPIVKSASPVEVPPVNG